MSRISRRLLMRGGVAAGLLMATGAHAAARKVHGDLRIGVPDLAAAREALRCGLTHDCLTEVAANGQLVGELAESWDSADAQVWELRLRQGVISHAGEAFDAQSAVTALEGRLPDVTGLRALGPGHLLIELSKPDADFPFRLSQVPIALAGDTGTGLYRPVEDAVFERVGTHYKDGRAGWFARVHLVALPSLEAQLATLEAGEVDVVPDLGGIAPLHRKSNWHLVSPAEIPAAKTLAQAEAVSTTAPFDDGRIAERWWFA